MTDVTLISQISEVHRSGQINGGQILILLGGVPNYGPGQVPKEANFGEIKLVISSLHLCSFSVSLSLSLSHFTSHSSKSLSIRI
jgi:hypothetical protein